MPSSSELEKWVLDDMRFHEGPKHQSVTILPPASSAKELCAANRQLLSGKYVITNLQRAVLRTVRENDVAPLRAVPLGQLIDPTRSKGHLIPSAGMHYVGPMPVHSMLAQLGESFESVIGYADLPDYLPIVISILDSAARNAASKGEGDEFAARLDNWISPLLHKRDRDASSDLLCHAQRLAERGQVDSALDIVYDQLDELLGNEKFDVVDEILRREGVDKLDVDILLAILTITLPAKSNLPTREAFLLRVEDSLRKRGELEPGLLAGLD